MVPSADKKVSVVRYPLGCSATLLRRVAWVGPESREKPTRSLRVAAVHIAEALLRAKQLLLEDRPALSDPARHEEEDDQQRIEEQQRHARAHQEERGVERMSDPAVRPVRDEPVVREHLDFRPGETS